MVEKNFDAPIIFLLLHKAGLNILKAKVVDGHESKALDEETIVYCRVPGQMFALDLV